MTQVCGVRIPVRAHLAIRFCRTTLIRGSPTPYFLELRTISRARPLYHSADCEPVRRFLPNRRDQAFTN